MAFFSRRGTATAGAISEISIPHVTGSRIVTAMRDGGGALRLIAWDIGTDGSISRRGTATAGAISKISIARVDSSRVVTAMRDGGGNLRLITWDIGVDGSISRRGTATAGAISEISIAYVRGSRIVTAMRDGGGALRLIAWDIGTGPVDGSISRRGTATAGAISKISITHVGIPGVGNSRVVTAMRDGGGNLRLITWDIGVDGSFSRRGTATAGAISEISITHVSGSRIVVTAMRDGGGALRLIAWDIEGSGNVLRRDTGVAAKVSEISVAHVGDNHPGKNRVVTAMRRDSGGILRLIAWGIQSP